MIQSTMSRARKARISDANSQPSASIGASASTTPAASASVGAGAISSATTPAAATAAVIAAVSTVAVSAAASAGSSSGPSALSVPGSRPQPMPQPVAVAMRPVAPPAGLHAPTSGIPGLSVITFVSEEDALRGFNDDAELNSTARAANSIVDTGEWRRMVALCYACHDASGLAVCMYVHRFAMLCVLAVAPHALSLSNVVRACCRSTRTIAKQCCAWLLSLHMHYR
jgi:hypothetical protein